MKIYFTQDPCFQETHLHLVEERPDGIYLAKPLKLEFEKYDPGSRGEPTLRLSSLIAMDFLKAFSDALDKQGIKPESVYKIEGLLEAKKEHLYREQLLLNRVLGLLEQKNHAGFADAWEKQKP
jgi:hypothetical protein